MALIFDIECDGLLPTVSKMHRLSWKEHNRHGMHGGLDTFLSAITPGTCIVGHNIIGYDLPALRKLYGIQYTVSMNGDTLNGVPVNIIDTYILSRLLNPDRGYHGLEEYGDRLGIKKIEVLNWDDAAPELYEARCDQDVLINEAVLDYLLREAGIELEELCFDKRTS